MAEPSSPLMGKRSRRHRTTDELARERSLLDAIADGDLDDHLTALAEAVDARRRLLHRVRSATALAILCVGDEVRINQAVSPRYLAGLRGIVIDVDESRSHRAVAAPGRPFLDRASLVSAACAREDRGRSRLTREFRVGVNQLLTDDQRQRPDQHRDYAIAVVNDLECASNIRALIRIADGHRRGVDCTERDGLDGVAWIDHRPERRALGAGPRRSSPPRGAPGDLRSA